MVTDFISGDYRGHSPATNALDNPKITRIKALITGRLSVSARDQPRATRCSKSSVSRRCERVRLPRIPPPAARSPQSAEIPGSLQTYSDLLPGVPALAASLGAGKRAVLRSGHRLGRLGGCRRQGGIAKHG